MNKFLLLIVLSSLLFACKSKKASLSDNDEEVDIPGFLTLVPDLKLPFQVTDTIFKHKDSVINPQLFTRLVPDTILSRWFGKGAKPRLYAVGKVKVPKQETYLFVKGLAKDRRVLYIICFDKKDRFSTARPILYSDNEPGVTGQASMDSKYTLTVSHQRKAGDGQILFHRDAYIFNEETGFVLILTESNEGKAKITPVFNPIDTLPRKHKFSGDYAQDKRNIVAIRDGRDASRFLFFVHFEKEEGSCKGELKGEAKFVSPGVARYKSYSDPCAIEFTFGSSGITLKEQGGCGVHRDIKCFFEGYYEHRKESRPKEARPKPAAKKA
ncbi:MAG: hypothetical protein JST68_23595 [Bacteroidetes bacterium]|nr:hypothetical protein [Bacteroidota bacterium]